VVLKFPKFDAPLPPDEGTGSKKLWDEVGAGAGMSMSKRFGGGAPVVLTAGGLTVPGPSTLGARGLFPPLDFGAGAGSSSPSSSDSLR